MSGCVYIIHALTTDYYKVGITIKSIEGRLRSLQTSIPFWNLEVVIAHYCDDYSTLEKLLHEKYSDQRLRNSEWFVFTDNEVAEMIETNDLLDGPSPERALPKRASWSKRPFTVHDLFPVRTDKVTEPIIEAEAIQITDLNPLRARLMYLHKEQGMTWRKIAEMEEFNNVSFGVLNGVYHGIEPVDDEIRKALGLDVVELIPQIRDNESGQFSKRKD
jgi:hypothetical protein